jgi:hypothetical protein
MKKLIVALVAFCAIASYAADKVAELSDAEKEAKKAQARQRMMEKTGGILEKPGTGRVVVVNAQDKFSSGDIESQVKKCNSAIRVKIDVEKGSWKLGDKLPAGANVAVFIVNDPALPISLVAMEEQWGVLNVAKLEGASRFNKALARVMISTLGAGVSQFKGSPMQTVTNANDLDKLHSEGITFDALQSIMRNLQNLGVTQARKTTYRRACMEGWAAQPTNSFQKAVWDEVHSIPKNPMQIKFDPKKGR